jgi:hypothetical protein
VSASFGVLGESTTGIGVIGRSDGGTGVFGSANANSGGLAGRFIGPVLIEGDLSVTGVKGALMPHSDGSHRLFCAIESPESWFEDFGETEVVNGKAEVQFDPDFAEFIDTSAYHVFLSPYGDSNGLYVADRTANGFLVQEQKGGTSNLAFSYRIVAKRKDIAPTRSAKIGVSAPPPGSAYPISPLPARASPTPSLPAETARQPYAPKPK